MYMYVCMYACMYVCMYVCECGSLLGGIRLGGIRLQEAVISDVICDVMWSCFYKGTWL
jgi:hypothetical protein